MGFEVEAPGRGKRRKGRSKPEMNVTPLVDVVLVLLIIFMVVMPAMHRYFALHIPPEPEESAENPPPDAATPIVVTVDAAGAIHINRDRYADDALVPRLRRMLVASADRKIYFDADDDAPFERAVRAMDLSRRAGAAHIAVLTERVQ